VARWGTLIRSANVVNGGGSRVLLNQAAANRCCCRMRAPHLLYMTAPRPRRLSEEDYPFQGLTRRIVAGFFHVRWSLGFGHTEAVYRRALAVELEHRGIGVAQHVRYEVRHRGVLVGTYEADLVAEQAVIVETKTGLVPDPSAPGQLLSYLTAAKLPVGLVLHFGPRGQVKRLVRSEYVALERRGRPISDPSGEKSR